MNGSFLGIFILLCYRGLLLLKYMIEKVYIVAELPPSALSENSIKRKNKHLRTSELKTFDGIVQQSEISGKPAERLLLLMWDSDDYLRHEIATLDLSNLTRSKVFYLVICGKPKPGELTPLETSLSIVRCFERSGLRTLLHQARRRRVSPAVS